ncbi:MAG: outer membrane beta-barrel protein [Betaproteobacteria bacterium]
MNKIVSLSFALAALVGAGAACAQDRLVVPPQDGFYGGVSLRDRGVTRPGVDLSAVTSAWAKYTSVLAEDSGAQALLYGGYRFANDVSVEAAFARTDDLALPLSRPGMGLALGTPGDATSRRWNADLYTSYNFGPAFSLYGRVGYKQSDALPAYLLLASSASVPVRQGVNYGVGLRYDMTPSLGLKLEYARFGRFVVDTFSGPFPESDQVQFGVQYRF